MVGSYIVYKHSEDIDVCSYMCSNNYYICMCSSVYFAKLYKSCKSVENSAIIFILGCMVKDTQTESRISCILPDQCKLLPLSSSIQV